MSWLLRIDFELDTLCLLVTEVNVSKLSLCLLTPLLHGPSQNQPDR